MRHLQLAYSRKEKIARLMANLETLRSQEGVSEDDYPVIRDEYEAFLNDAEQNIEKLREQTEQRIELLEQDLGDLERDRQRMEVRLKVGEMSQEKFAREVGRIDRRIMNTQNDIAQCRKSLEANSSAELGGFVDVPIDHEADRASRLDIERVSERQPCSRKSVDSSLGGRRHPSRAAGRMGPHAAMAHIDHLCRADVRNHTAAVGAEYRPQHSRVRLRRDGCSGVRRGDSGMRHPVSRQGLCSQCRRAYYRRAGSPGRFS